MKIDPPNPNQQPNQPHIESPFKGRTGLRRLLNAFGYSLDGFKAAYKHEDAFRQEVLLAAIFIPLAFYLEQAVLNRTLMIGSILLLLIVELLNSAIEAVVDRVSIERHELAKRAKDIGSAAVFIALVNVVIIWCLILFS
ncbi:MAG: diacylglycerol kinase [Pseudomonadota bacterium]